MALIQFPECSSRPLCARPCIREKGNRVPTFNKLIILVVELGMHRNNLKATGDAPMLVS